MNVNDAFPSDYLKAADLKGREPTVIIREVQMATLGNDQKMVAYFEKADKGLVLNKTNAMNIAAMYGPETEGWLGKAVKLVKAWVDYQGKSVEAIRVRPPEQRGAPAQQFTEQSPPPRAAAPAVVEYDDEIPF